MQQDTPMPQLIRLPKLCELLDCSRHGVISLEEKDPTFPRRIKFGESRVSPVYYDLMEIRQWLESKKEKVGAPAD